STIASDGYQTAFIRTGIFQGLMILIVAQFLRHPPHEDEPVKAAAVGAQVGRRHFTTSEMLRTPQFYTMYAMFVLVATGGLLITANAGPIASFWGFAPGVLTIAASLSPIANGTSRIVWGWASDRTGRENAMAIAFGLQAFCLLLVLMLGPISGGWFAFTL